METSHRSDAQKLFVIRAIHTVIYIVMAGSVLFVLYCGITGSTGPVLGTALTLVLTECIIFIGFGFKCPLSAVARKYGAEEKNFSDLFMPRWLARHTPAIFGSLLALALLLIVLRQLHLIH